MAFKKLPAKSAGLVAPLILTFLMSGMVSAISLIRVQGFSIETLGAWPSAWLVSWVVAFPVILIVQPIVRVVVRAIVEQ